MIDPIRRFSVLCLLAIAIAGAAGCGGGNKPRLVAVAGHLTLAGQPLTAGSLSFHADDGNPYAGDKPSCQLQLDGSFTMRTYPFGDGVPPGKYKVTLVPALAARIKKPELGDPAKTNLRIDVPDAGIADHRIDLP